MMAKDMSSGSSTDAFHSMSSLTHASWPCRGVGGGSVAELVAMKVIEAVAEQEEKVVANERGLGSSPPRPSAKAESALPHPQRSPTRPAPGRVAALSRHR